MPFSPSARAGFRSLGDDIKPVYNLKALTFSFPDADGMVTVSAPNGTFPPGTEILIINSGNGVVLGLTAGNDGQVQGTLPASTSDTLFVTVTDPFGNSTSFQTSTFVNSATGETAVGPGGGTIEGPEGTSLIIPEGALDKGIPMKLEVLTPEQYDALFPNQRPAFGTRPLGSVLKIHAAEPGTFNKPVKLTFNVPSNFATTHPGADPRDAVFYTLKRSVLEDGTVAFEVVDHAFAVCPGDMPGTEAEPIRTCDVADLKVKTASRPYPEFTGNFLADMYIVMAFDWEAATRRSAYAGVVVGRVRRQVWGSETTAGQARYEPVVGARVTGSDAEGNELKSANRIFTTSQQDGTYTLWDSAYTGGTVTVYAEANGKTSKGLGYEGNPQDTSATIFSGAPPKETGAAALQWFNRKALLNPGGGFGTFSQCLGFSDRNIGIRVMYDADGCNRHFKVPFVYDDLKNLGMKSIVVWQQAGIGQGTDNPALAGQNEWLKPRKRGYAHVGLENLINRREGVDNDRDESRALDVDSTEIAEERLRKSGDFDLLVVYLAGLDHYLHLTGPDPVGGNGGQGQAYIRSSLAGFMGRIKTAVEKSGDGPVVYGVLSDHGHVQTESRKFMNLDTQGPGLPSWSQTLGANKLHHISLVPWTRDRTMETLEVVEPNVVFTPQFGLASIYVSPSVGLAMSATAEVIWKLAPQVSSLEPMVKRIHKNYFGSLNGGTALRPWPLRPLADILVRVPGSLGSFDGSEYKVVPRELDYDRPLLDQLRPLSSLEGLGIGDNLEDGSVWRYANPVDRLTNYISPNTGDILVLANVRDGYQFGDAYRGNHGSLTSADANVPIAFAYPGYTDKDSTFGPLIEYLKPGAVVTEAEALRAFLIRPRP